MNYMSSESDLFHKKLNLKESEILQNNNNNTSIAINENQEFKKINEEYLKLKRKEELSKMTMIESQKKWTNFSLEILNIASQLISHSQKVKNGIETDLENNILETFNSKISKYEQFLRKNAEELEKSSQGLNNNNTSNNKSRIESASNKNNLNQNKSYFNETEQNQSNIINNNMNNNISQNIIQENSLISNQKSIVLQINYDTNHLLDFNVLKGDLAKVNSFNYDTDEFYDRINYGLRELRLRLSRRKYKSVKNNTLYAIINYDLLGLKSKHVKIYSNLLSNVK